MTSACILQLRRNRSAAVLPKLAAYNEATSCDRRVADVDAWRPGWKYGGFVTIGLFAANLDDRQAAPYVS